MSNPDSFIDEVNEELKRDRLFAALKKYGWIAIVAVVALVGWATWNEWSKARDTAAAQAFGDAVIAAIGSDDPAARQEALGRLIDGSDIAAAQQGMVQFLIAAEALEGGDRGAALEALAAVAGNAELPGSYRQLATLKRVIAATEAEIPLAERQQMIAPLTAPGMTFRPLALEQQALLQLEAGDRDAALAGLQTLLSEPELTDNLRSRVSQVIVMLGATPGQGRN